MATWTVFADDDNSGDGYCTELETRDAAMRMAIHLDHSSRHVWVREYADADHGETIFDNRAVPFVDICEETAYGTKTRLSFQVRVF